MKFFEEKELYLEDGDQVKSEGLWEFSRHGMSILNV
jgi:hypothetical protein